MESELYNKIYKLQKEGWWFGNSRNKLVISLLKEIYPELKNKKLLDIGCSEGAFLDYLKKEKINFKAIDIDNNAITFCKKRGFSKELKKGSILDIPFKKNSFEIVTALDVVEHVKDDKKAISEMKRVCKNKGILFLILPAHPRLWSSFDEAYHHHRRYDLKRIKYLAKTVNLKIKNISYFNMLLFPVFIALVYHRKLFPNIKKSTVLKPLPKPINYLLTKIMDIEINIIKRNISKKRRGCMGGSYIVILEK